MPTPRPDNAQQWVLDFNATEISNSWKRFLVAPEPQPEAVMEFDPPATAEAEDSVLKAEDLVGEKVHPETVALGSASEYGETPDVFTVLKERPAAVVEEVSTAFTEVSSEDAISADEALSSEAAVVQVIKEVASPGCEYWTAETPASVSAAPHEPSGPSKSELLLFFPLHYVNNLHPGNLCHIIYFLFALKQGSMCNVSLSSH